MVYKASASRKSYSKPSYLNLENMSSHWEHIDSKTTCVYLKYEFISIFISSTWNKTSFIAIL